MKSARHKYLVFIVISVVSATLLWWLNSLPLTIKSKVTDSEFGRQLLPLYRSLRKLPDIVFFPYLFIQTDLPELSLDIESKDILYLNDNLPKSSPFTSISLDENRVFVKGMFQSDGFISEADVRYKGLNSNHWNSFKKSYRVKFSEGHLFEGASALNLVLPSDKLYYAPFLNMYRAEKFGLLTPDMRFMNVILNGENHGVYIVSDHWSRELLDKKGVPAGSNIFGVDDGSMALFGGDNEVEYESVLSLYDIEFIGGWKSYIEEKERYKNLEALISIVDTATDEVFEREIPKLLDMEKFYRWDILTILAGNPQYDFENVMLLRNAETGKFEMVPIDIVINPAREHYTENSTLSQRILSVDAFRERRNELLAEYIDNPDNLRDDLKFYDNLYESTKGAFFKDTAKKDNNFVFMNTVAETRWHFINNFHNARNVLENEYAR